MPNPKRERKRQGQQARQEYLRAEAERARRKGQIVKAVVAAVVIALVVAVFSLGGGDTAKAKKVGAGASSTTSSTSTPGEVTTTTATTAAGGEAPAKGCPAADGSAQRRVTFSEPPPMCIDPARSYSAKVVTDAGTFTIDLAAAKAPRTVNNFVVLSRYHFYDGVAFHRVIPGFVVQGGDGEKGDGTGGPGYRFADELPKAGEYTIGSVAMANSGPDTNGSQFYVITGPNGVALPPKYSLFGQVGADGLAVVKKIEADGGEPTPKVVHKITAVTITEK